MGRKPAGNARSSARAGWVGRRGSRSAGPRAPVRTLCERPGLEECGLVERTPDPPSRASPFRPPHASVARSSGQLWIGAAARCARRVRLARSGSTASTGSETVVLRIRPCIESRPPAMDAILGPPQDRAPGSSRSDGADRARGRPRSHHSSGTRGARNSDVGWYHPGSPPAARGAVRPGDPASGDPANVAPPREP